MSEQSSYFCEPCGRWLESRGRVGHERSRVHLENVRAKGDGVDPVDEVAARAGVSRGELDELASENAELRRKLAAVERERDTYRPFVEVANPESAGDVIAHYGLDHMRVIAEVSLAADNKQRVREGRPPLWANRDEYEQLIAETVERKAEEMAGDRHMWTSGVKNGSHTRLRTFKMVTPDGRMVQIPIDVTVNNGNGSLGDPILRYQRKGFKVASPVRCKLVDCYEPAPFEDGRYLFNGYCSVSHERFMEGDVLTRSDGQRVNVYETAGL